MSSISCLINNGNSLTPFISEILFQTAHEIMGINGRKQRIKEDSIELSGEVVTEYKYGSMGGSTGGIVFRASLDWNGGSAKTDFIVRPSKDKEELLGGGWIRVPMFPAAEVEPVYN